MSQLKYILLESIYFNITLDLHDYSVGLALFGCEAGYTLDDWIIANTKRHVHIVISTNLHTEKLFGQ